MTRRAIRRLRAALRLAAPPVDERRHDAKAAVAPASPSRHAAPHQENYSAIGHLHDNHTM
jgi:hypothetical protein